MKVAPSTLTERQVVLVPRGASHVQLRLPNDNMLEVSLWKGTKLLLREEKQYTCVSEGIEISYDTRSVGGNGLGTGVDWGVLHLAKSADRALTVKKRSQGVGLILVIPVIGRSVSWHKFGPAKISHLTG
ncbi:MAG: hypothetical protein QXS68_06115 [Candidatus Methanomethylicaceae archaeon]